MVKPAKSLFGGVLALFVFLFASVEAATTTTVTKGGPTPSAAPTFFFPSPAPTSLPSTKPSGGSDNSTMRSCPGPLIPNIHNLKIQTCMDSCCLKCPAINNFYEPNKVDNVLTAAYITRQISLGLVLFMTISYLVLPGKRSQPHISVLFLTVSLSLWFAAFDVMPGITNACANDYESATSSNSKLCGIQGVLIIYLTQTSALWCSLLIYKLHL
ncbi:hypothetical protein BGZ65_007107, partial [Modicella reniformis]